MNPTYPQYNQNLYPSYTGSSPATPAYSGAAPATQPNTYVVEQTVTTTTTPYAPLTPTPLSPPVKKDEEPQTTNHPHTITHHDSSSSQHLHHHKHVRPVTKEDQEAFLKDYNFFILIDKSGSMNEEEEAEDTTRWGIVQECLKTIVTEAIKFDDDGAEVCFFATKVEHFQKIESAAKVMEVLKHTKPGGSTNLGEALEKTFELYQKRKQKDPNYKGIALIITDGEPDDDKRVHEAIINFTHTINKKHIFKYKRDGQPIRKTLDFGIRFFQVGSDQEATARLKIYHDHLTKEKASVDMVSTGNIEELGERKVREAFVDAIFG